MVPRNELRYVLPVQVFTGVRMRTRSETFSRCGRNNWSCGSGWRQQITLLALQPVGRLTLVALKAGDLQAQVVDQGAADEAPHGMRLPIGGAHDLGYGGAVRAFEQPDDVRFLGASACRRCVRSGAVLAACFAFRSRVAASVLERLPHAAHG